MVQKATYDVMVYKGLLTARKERRQAAYTMIASAKLFRNSGVKPDTNVTYFENFAL